jgi:hypothetical protein
MTAKCRRKDVERFTGIGFRENDEDSGLVDLVDEEANYGNYEEMQKIASEGIVFTAQHGAGGDYGPCAYVGIDGELHEAAIDEGDGRLVVSLDEHGDPSQIQVRAAKEFLVARKRAEAALESEDAIEAVESAPCPA